MTDTPFSSGSTGWPCTGYGSDPPFMWASWWPTARSGRTIRLTTGYTPEIINSPLQDLVVPSDWPQATHQKSSAMTHLFLEPVSSPLQDLIVPLDRPQKIYCYDTRLFLEPVNSPLQDLIVPLDWPQAIFQKSIAMILAFLLELVNSPLQDLIVPLHWPKAIYLKSITTTHTFFLS